MQTTRPMNLLIVGGIIIVLMMGFIVPNSIADIITYPDDGVWEDTFDDNSALLLKNCEVKNKEIVLKQGATQIQYNFLEQSDHSFYVYTTFFFLPATKLFSPERHLGREYQLGGKDIDNIETINKVYTSRSSFTIRRVIVHHFRFHVDLDESSMENIRVIWYGKADAFADINFYFWNSSYFLVGGWENLGYNRSSGSDTNINISISGGKVKYAVDSENYIDISVVAYFPLQLKSCTLATDYVGLLAKTELGYTTNYGQAETKHAIDPKNITANLTTFYWDLLAWDDSQQGGAKVRYQVVYVNATGDDVLVEEATLPGNTKGFTTSPVPLNNLSNYKYKNKYLKLKIRANLTTESPSVSPRIFNWAVTWQNWTHWQDSFNTYYRIDKRSKIYKDNGTIMISKIQDEWPTFGFNPENTRASDCKGALTGNLYWYGTEDVGGGFRNPVIGNGMVYIFSDKQSLHRYNITLPSGSTDGSPQSNWSSLKINFDCVNSPAITDEFVIVATGEQGEKGHQNHIYGYEKDNLTLKWDFSYGGKNICYDASSIVVDNTLFISTWGGDNGHYLLESSRYTNNQLIALNLNDMTIENFTLPAPGLSTPAVTGDIVIVTCNSTDNDSVFALSLSGEKIWSRAVGAVGHASPVIYGNAVFVTCTQEESNRKATTKIVAMNLNDGNILWNATVSEQLPSRYMHFSESTPAVYDNVLYVASPDGTVHALAVSNGTKLWSTSIYSIPFGSSDVLLSSPAYADNNIYIGTPAGKIMALNATTGKTTWEYKTYGEWGPTPVLGSPIVSNGLVYIADENGYLYSFGKFIASTNEVTGSITSVPIRLPEAYWWGNFYANVSYNADISKITFKLLDENGNILNGNLANTNSLSLAGPTLGRAVRLQADFSSDNISKNNPKLLKWYITLSMDTVKPYLISSTFTPDPNGWLPEIVPSFSIKAMDNYTGLRVNSAKYNLTYTLNNVSQSSTYHASCTGENGTKDKQTITMNISALSFFDNITSLKSITFEISDMAGNTISKTVTFKQDTKKPTSRVKTSLNRYNSSDITISATANDTGTLNVDASGIKLVELYYRYSENRNFSGDWILFGNSTGSSPTWKFTFANHPNQHGGFFELCTVATDYAGHVEDFPTTGDIWFLWDWQKPSLPSISGDTLWFKERPRFSVVFEDDYRLDTIQYKPNFEASWTTIATDVNSSSYDTDYSGKSWSLKQEYWDRMNEGEIYYLYFRINDTLGNTQLVTSDNQAIVIGKDTAIPIVAIDIASLETEWSWADNYTVSGLANDQNGSGIKEVLLYYRFSDDKSNWSNWEPFGDILDISPFEWNFTALKGDGYYEFKINVTDYADNTVESEVFSLAVASFPVDLALVMLGLVIVLLLVTSIIFIIWRKRK
jgi:outer membrane protein assembly factor BamB